MKQPLRIGLSAALSLGLALLLAGCGVTLGAPEQSTPPPGPPAQPPPTQPPPVAGGGGTVSISPQYVALSPGQTVHFTATASGGGQLQYLVNGVVGGSTATGTVDASGNYTAPGSLSQSENTSITAELVASPQNNATAVASIIVPGRIYPTGNPQVVQYSIYLPVPGNVTIQFGPTTTYGLNTWQVATPTPDGGQVTIYVAGMLAKTLYHMRAQIALNDGATLNDPDHDQFASGASLVTGSPPVTSPVTITSAGTPQPGIEMWNTILPAGDTQAFATDLRGNVIWTYSYTGTFRDFIQGVQLLPNGNMLMVISYLSSLPQNIVDETPGTLNEIREVDLAGNTVSDLTMDTLNQKLSAAGFHDSDGSNYQLKSFHHWVLPLPNGHMVLLASYPKSFPNLPLTGGMPVLGDVLVDVDQNFNPDWVWSAFDHLDVNRHPMNFPDWTHSNDMIYSSDDHNLLLSIRHQNWIIKIDFNDAHGSGNILWRLGEGGDFKLVGGTDPTDWFYAQHGLYFFTPNTTGDFRLGIMDNGNDRIFPPPTGQVFCKTTGTSQCYSTVPVLEINETNMTATLVTHYMPPPSYYNYFGGNVEQLGNGDMHLNFCAAASGTIVQELDPTGSQVIWQGTTANSNQFRVDRLGSLYPGVQW